MRSKLDYTTLRPSLCGALLQIQMRLEKRATSFLRGSSRFLSTEQLLRKFLSSTESLPISSPSIKRAFATDQVTQLHNVPSQKAPEFRDLPASHGHLTLTFQNGVPILVVPLPSRTEPCQFTLRPFSDTVGSFCEQLKQEDHGIDYVGIYMSHGVRVATSTSMERLIQFRKFRLRINDRHFDVDVAKLDLDSISDRVRYIDDMRAVVAQLYGVLNINEYKAERERRLQERLEETEEELKPLQETKALIECECKRHSERLMITGFAAMGIQTGIFARLTWWDFSWDIIEPFTYFTTYSTIIATFGYYLYTKQPFEYQNAQELIFSKQFYKRAAKHNFNISRYNDLVARRDEICRLLRCIRDPLQLHMPIPYLSKYEKP